MGDYSKIKLVKKPFHIMVFVSIGLFVLAIVLFAIFGGMGNAGALMVIPGVFLGVAEVLGIIYMINFWRCMQRNQEDVFGNHSPMSYIILGRLSRGLAVYCCIIFPLMGFLHYGIMQDAGRF